MDRSGKGFVKMWVLALVVVLAVAGVVGAFSLPGLGKHEKVKAVNGTVTIPLAAVADGKAHFYKYSQGGKEVAFFVVKSPGGAVKTAFDACDVCFREKKGYEQGGGFMVCKQCNKKFDINRIGEGAGGGCNPSFLPSRQVGNAIVIATSDLMAGSRFF
ncbi:DUF2318 domain-containing protein [Geobacter pickeringii]|uniref:Membrane iron-sulfur containing protein FtrD-like domain-containing protein n=1 Tax=Geobacter pickeringii TaxID=345632 RepID=A0A0B5BAJ9_9BACT|nr:DUF2318 domain-containing protein [Geobacter pickeringii]AJE03602.1 hypothetical protein GPICK_09785 [Geobacter pickeringii]